jgi:uncharacterized protein
MRLDHTFTVSVPVDEAWKVLLDLPTVAPCMPGATLTGVEGDTFTGTVKVKLGPVALTYQGKGRFVERDEAAHRVVIEASGRDPRAAGTAAATVTATLLADGDVTRVDVLTDLTVTGRPAQFGRGMLADVSGKLIGQFADCLADTLTAPAAAAAPAPAAVTEVGVTEVAVTEVGVTEVGAGEAVGAEAEGPTQTAVRQPLAPRPEAEPVDLLRVVGSTNAAKRYAAYLAGLAVLGVLVWILIRVLRR